VIFLIVGDPAHYRLDLGVLHLIGDSAYFLGSKAPKLWIVRLRTHDLWSRACHRWKDSGNLERIVTRFAVPQMPHAAVVKMF